MSDLLSIDPLARSEPLGGRAIRFALILAAHLAVLWGALELAARPEVRQTAKELYVRLVETSLPEPAKRPEPVQKAEPRRQAVPMPLPILTAPAEAAAPAPVFAVPPQPPAPPPVVEAAPVAVAPAPTPVVKPARFDADYLANPKPAYPIASRRLGEEGKVMLRVKVSHGGAPVEIEVKQGSGFPRLDEAAREAVQRWRFQPASRDGEPIESWVTVPIAFNLQGQ